MKSAIAAVALAACAVTTSPSHARGGNCLWEFTGGFTVTFANLDPSNAVNVTQAVGAVSANSNRAGDCQPTGQTMSFTATNGNNFGNGSRRMTNGTYFIPYTINAFPTPNRPGNDNYTTINFTITIPGTGYQDVAAGTYIDNVTITVSP